MQPEEKQKRSQENNFIKKRRLWNFSPLLHNFALACLSLRQIGNGYHMKGMGKWKDVLLDMIFFYFCDKGFAVNPQNFGRLAFIPMTGLENRFDVLFFDFL